MQNINNTNRFQGKVALVTGAGDGIGAEIAHQFLAAGAQVLAVDISEEKLRRAFDADNPNLRLLTADVAAKGAADQMIAEVEAAFNHLDILVNSAGVYLQMPVETITDENWDRVININLSAIFRLCRSAIPLLKASPSGRIINIASVEAMRAHLHASAYVTSKHGLAGLTKALAVELGPDRVTANYVCPGFIKTGLTRDIMVNPDANTKKFIENFGVLGRIGLPEDIAYPVLFLASSEASFITGHGLVVDGGYLPKG
jgi:NAD(P)-dependent dehydrogenase (short-subunit alcohol dehydrogenase family)